MSSIDRVRVFPGEDGQWYYEPKGTNGETLSTSEGYTEKGSALRAVRDFYPDAAIDVDGEEPA